MNSGDHVQLVSGNMPVRRSMLRELAFQVKRAVITGRHLAQLSLGRERPVVARVQGVDLVLPRGHTLPMFAELFPRYGQNLVGLAQFLQVERGREITVVDIGANVGDSARQICAAANAEVLCVEGDPVWLPYLEKNLIGLPCVIEPSFIAIGGERASRIVRQGGTSKLVPADRPEVAQSFIEVDELLHRHQRFKVPDLIKTDTDGHDCAIVSVLIGELRQDSPVIFFEYDPAMTLSVGGPSPLSVWAQLAEAGYSNAFVWDNFGSFIGAWPIDQMMSLAKNLLKPRRARSYDYWDVAVFAEAQRESALRFAATLGGEPS